MKDTRLRLMLDYPFFGSIALDVDLKESYTATKTMSTNSKNIFYNPDFVATLTPGDKLYIYQHEICHIILGHSFRRGDRDFDTWNIACDYAINLMLTEMLKTPAPDGGLYELKYKGWSAEQIYEDIYDEFQEQIEDNASAGKPDPNAKPDPNTQTTPGPAPDPDPASDPNAQPDPNAKITPAPDPIDPKKEEFDKMIEQAKKHGLVEDAPEELEEYEIESKVNMADQVTNGAGIEEGSMIREVITEMTSTDVAWRELLARFVNQSCDSYYDWMVPSQRYSFGDIIMPSLSSKSSLKLAVVIDTSGSIDNILLKIFMSEFKSLIASVEYEELYMVSCDTRIHNPQKYLKHEPIDYISKGGGGTYFYPVWEHFKEECFTPDCLIYFTDLDVSDYCFGKDPGYPVLFIGDFWDKHKKIPFGEKADIKRAA